uniref:Uncharacterized protein n=1 Tax=Aeromonas hydrophila TaxID=644 RepID=Q6TP05_AERHY|nr:unknown [Aeromonas hydrophila]
MSLLQQKRPSQPEHQHNGTQPASPAGHQVPRSRGHRGDKSCQASFYCHTCLFHFSWAKRSTCELVPSWCRCPLDGGFLHVQYGTSDHPYPPSLFPRPIVINHVIHHRLSPTSPSHHHFVVGQKEDMKVILPLFPLGHGQGERVFFKSVACFFLLLGHIEFPIDLHRIAIDPIGARTTAPTSTEPVKCKRVAPHLAIDVDVTDGAVDHRMDHDRGPAMLLLQQKRPSQPEHQYNGTQPASPARHQVPRSRGHRGDKSCQASFYCHADCLSCSNAERPPSR